jgi:sortase A
MEGSLEPSIYPDGFAAVSNQPAPTAPKRGGMVLPIIAALLLLLAGIAVLGYPSFANWYAQKGNEEIVQNYEDAVAALSEEEIQAELQKAVDYNRRLDGSTPIDPFAEDAPLPFGDYKDILDVNGTGVMGAITIPKIKVELPIFHGVTPKVLEQAVGHIPTTALPVGGSGTHSVLAAHRGLPRRELFTKLDVLEKGDVFQITVLNKKLYYEVDQISVVEPDQTDSFTPVAGEDYVTLATCTPLGVNSHRLLVRGRRCDAPPQSEQPAAALSVQQYRNLLVGGAAAVVVIIIWVIAAAAMRRNRRGGERR